MLEKIQELSQSFLSGTPQKFKRYFFSQVPADSRLSFILGSRGVGKTTAILQRLSDFDKNEFSKKILYVPADHIFIGQTTLYNIAEEFYLNGGKLIAFDEIHKYDNWAQEIKSIYDTFKEIRIIVSGSSSLEVKKGAYDLSRRALVFNMKHMSFREFIELEKEIVFKPVDLESILKNHQNIAKQITQKLKKKDLKVIPLFKQYLKKGSFPLYVDYQSTTTYYRALEQVINTIIENDILAVYPKLTGVTIKRLKKLLNYISESCPFTPDLKKIKNLLDIKDERTLKQYFHYLDKAGIILTFEKTGGNLAAFKKPEKVYLNNTNYIYALEGIASKDIGNIRETFTANILSNIHALTIPTIGDFMIDGNYIFEIGGKNKSIRQIKGLKNSYVLADDVELGLGNKIPLWLLGFLY